MPYTAKIIQANAGRTTSRVDGRGGLIHCGLKQALYGEPSQYPEASDLGTSVGSTPATMELRLTRDKIHLLLYVKPADELVQLKASFTLETGGKYKVEVSHHGSSVQRCHRLIISSLGPDVP